MKIDKINVRNRDTDYPIFIGNGALSLLGKQIKSMCPQTRKIALILDKNIPQKFKKKIKRTLSSYKVFSKEYLPNENLKSFKEAGKLVEKLLQNKFNRGDTIGYCNSLQRRTSIKSPSFDDCHRFRNVYTF